MDPELAKLRRRTADTVARLHNLAPGPVLLTELSRLRAMPMDAPTAVDVVALLTKIEAWVAAQKMVFTHDALTGVRGMLDVPHGESVMLTAQELACATHVSYATAMDAVTLTQRVSDSMPASWMALDRGQITIAHLKAVEKATRHCPARVAQAVDEQVIPLAIARDWTPSEVTRAARKLVIALDPAGAKDRAAAAKDNADVRFYPEPDEVASIHATGDAALARQVMDAINDRAEAMGRAGDDRNVGVRRFHALADLVLGSADSALTVAGTTRRTAPRGTTLLELTTALGEDDHPGELAGYGPITADTARKIAADSMLRRLIRDPLTGNCLDLGLTAYRPSAALRRAAEATHPTCTMPGCSRPATDCEIDHRTERHEGGRTDRCNLKPLCKMHHQMKTKKYWRVDINPDGSETWTSLLGFTHTKKPAWFPLPDPIPAEDEPPADIADRLPQTFDPDPPYPSEPLPDAPALDDEQYEAMERALDSLAAFGMTFRQWCDRYYDEARATGLVA